MTPEQLTAAADAMEKARDQAREHFRLFWSDNEMAAARMLVFVLVEGLRAAAAAAPERQS